MVLPSDLRWHHGVRQQGAGPITTQRPPCLPQGVARVMPGDASGQCHAGPPQPGQPTVPLRQPTPRDTQRRSFRLGVTDRHQLAVWCSGMTRTSGARGPGLHSRNGPCCSCRFSSGLLRMQDSGPCKVPSSVAGRCLAWTCSKYVFTTPSGVPTSHARTVLAASAVVARCGTGQMGHAVRPWQSSDLRGVCAHTGSRTQVTSARGSYDATTPCALVRMIDQPGE